MFTWMNRRLYHAIRIWFQLFGVLIAALGIISGLVYLISYIGTTYGEGYGMLTFLLIFVNIVTMFMCWMHAKLYLRDDRELVKRYRESKNPPLSWRLFKWMNRHVYYFLLNYIAVLAMFVAFIAAVVGIIMLLEWMQQQYGSKAAFITLGGIMVLVASFVIAFFKSEEAVKEEIKDQNRIYKSLTTKWD